MPGGDVGAPHVAGSAAASPAARALDRTALLVATAGGAGFAPVAPGTVASALTALLLGLAPFTAGGVLVFALAAAVIGTWAAHRAEPLLGGKDPGAIVVDEVAGMAVAVLGAPLTPSILAAGFVLFRVFDVVKPFPARAAERLPGGYGVMADDLVAGLYALAGVGLLRAAGWL